MGIVFNVIPILLLFCGKHSEGGKADNVAEKYSQCLVS